MTREERLQLLNQYLILGRLDPNGGWDEQARIVQSGYTKQYWKLTEPLADEVSTDDCEFVEDVLSMYGAMQRPYVLATPAEPVPADLQLPGFDGDNEGPQLAYAKFLMQDQGRWSDLAIGPHDLNSHSPTLDMYRRMVDEWTFLGAPDELRETHYEALANARAHPDHR
jgi:uncharacterized protein YfbU (UPF0304 family)